MNFESIGPILGIGSFIVLASAAVFALTKQAINKTTTETWRGEAEARTAANDRLSGEMAVVRAAQKECEAREGVLHARVTEIENTNKTLSELVTQATGVALLDEKMSERFTTIERLLKELHS